MHQKSDNILNILSILLPGDRGDYMKQPKLVRDRIPEIIKAKGRTLKYSIAKDDSEYYRFLMKKLDEEVKELKESNNPDELPDIMEVLYALAEYHKISPEMLEEKRKQKLKERGGFKKRIILADW